MAEGIAAVVVNHGGWSACVECLASLEALGGELENIIVIDNSDDKAPIEHIKKWAKGELVPWRPANDPMRELLVPSQTNSRPYRLFWHPKTPPKPAPLTLVHTQNRGFAAAVNLGIQSALLAGAKYVWVLNDDIIVHRYTLDEMKRVLESQREIAMVGSVQYYQSDPMSVQSAGGGFNRWLARFWNIEKEDFKDDEVAYIYGASMLIRADAYENVGPFCEDYFMYYEEIDYAQRLGQKGLRHAVARDAKTFHRHKGSISKKGEAFRTFYLERGKLLFYKKFYPKLLWIPVLMAIRKFLLTGDLVYLKALWEGVRWRG